MQWAFPAVQRSMAGQFHPSPRQVKRRRASGLHGLKRMTSWKACQIFFCHPDRAKRKRATRDQREAMLVCSGFPGKSLRVDPSTPRQKMPLWSG